jgi:hypothetical protein
MHEYDQVLDFVVQSGAAILPALAFNLKRLRRITRQASLLFSKMI